MYPCVRSCSPVKIEARLAAQIEVVTNIFGNRTPSAARRSKFGVFNIGCPAQPSRSQRWSSDKKKIKFGRGAVWAFKENNKRIEMNNWIVNGRPATDGTPAIPEEGKIYKVNTTARHTFVNTSNNIRIHFMGCIY